MINTLIKTISADNPHKTRNRSIAGVLAMIGLFSVEEWVLALNILGSIVDFLAEVLETHKVD